MWDRAQWKACERLERPPSPRGWGAPMLSLTGLPSAWVSLQGCGGRSCVADVCWVGSLRSARPAVAFPGLLGIPEGRSAGPRVQLPGSNKHSSPWPPLLGTLSAPCGLEVPARLPPSLDSGQPVGSQQDLPLNLPYVPVTGPAWRLWVQRAIRSETSVMEDQEPPWQKCLSCIWLWAISWHSRDL